MSDKYSAKTIGVFNDPAVRCVGCQKILDREELSKVGHCKFCGGRRVAALQTLNSREMKLLIKWQVDPEFMALFKPTEGVKEDDRDREE